MDDVLLTRYIAGECSEQEAATVRAWMAADPEHARRVNRMQQVWDEVGIPSGAWDTIAAWERVRSRIRADLAPARQDRPARASGRLGMRARTFLPRVAAAVIVVAVVAVLLVRLVGREEHVAPVADWQVIETGMGQQGSMQLPDGTVIKLNAGSKLMLPRHFADSLREVRLDGEAYFSVAKDSLRPFRVRTSAAVVQVLGTEFDLRAYDDEETTQVAVAEGRVLLRSRQSPASLDTTILTARDVGTVKKGHLQPTLRNVSLDQYLAWTEGRFVFVNAPFGEVVRQLERRYDLAVEVRVPLREIRNLNVDLDGQGLNQILDVIASTLNLSYKRDSTSVVFFRQRL